MARLRHEIDPLVELSKLDADASFVPAAHIRRDKTRSDLFASVTVGPTDFALAVRSRLNNSPSNKAV
jgi:hypothetical protein